MSGQRRKIWSIQQAWQTAAGLVDLVDDSFGNSKVWDLVCQPCSSQCRPAAGC